MKKIRKISVWAMAALTLSAGLSSCNQEVLDTNQYNKDGVSLLAFGPMPVTRGATMRVTGTRLNDVREVLFPQGNQKLTPATTFVAADFTVESAEEMTVTIPDQSVPGKLRIVTSAGDTLTSTSSITFAEEISVTSIAPNPVHPGDIVTISGEFVWNIGEVVFFDHVAVPAESFVKNTRKEIQVRVPMEAKAGAVAYSDGSEGAEATTIATLEVDAAKATGISNATPEFGETVTITGENLDLVTTIDFPAVPDVPFTTAPDGSSISVAVPTNTVSGTVTLTSASGLTTSVEITVPLASVSSTDPVKDVKVGQMITIIGDKLDRIVRLQLPAIAEPLQKGQFEQSPAQIRFAVPEGMGDGRVVLVQHDNWSIESDKIAMYSDAPEQAIWSGEFVCSSWNGNQDLAWGGFDWTTIPAGTKLMFYYKKNNPGQWGCISLRHGENWGNLPAPIPGQYDLEEDAGVLSVVFTQEVLDDIIAGNGLVVTGDNYTLTKIAIPASEIVVWQGQAVADDWGNQPYILSDGGAELLEAGLKVGSIIRVYITPTEQNWNCQIVDGHWGPTFADCDFNQDNWNLDEHNGALEFKVTADIYAAITTAGGWGGSFILNGDNVICTKVTIE
ncbi:MAG: hypothetical protein K6B45_05845 [Bacteroidaceae bacterium]|nr:hypothetical protein [Bacteroidaceae bacterium]